MDTGFIAVLKPVITPTKLELLKAIKTCDIISPGSQGLAGDICYVFQHLTTIETV
jgi:hypothetical protein